MNNLKNKVQLVGRLGAKPEIKTTTNGKKLASFSLATNESYRNAKGKRIEDTQWHRIVAWGSLADIAEKYADKGKEMMLQGKLVNRNYTDQEGNKRYITEIQATDIMLMGEKSSAPLN